MWLKYINNIKQKYGNIKNIVFRDKSNGWRKYNVKIEFDNGKIISEEHTKNEYVSKYLSKTYLKEKCQKCNFHISIDSMADI